MKAVYPGTFDPVTYGHLDLMRRGTKIFSELVVAVAPTSRKNPLFTLEERLDFVKKATSNIGNIVVQPLDGLLVHFAREIGASVILKGLRAISDFEYELQMSLINRRLADEIETVFMMPSEEFSFVSSSLIKEIASLKGNIETMVPPEVEKALKERLSIQDK